MQKEFTEISTLPSETVGIPLEYGDIFIALIHMLLVAGLTRIVDTIVLPEAAGLLLLAGCLLPVEQTGLP